MKTRSPHLLTATALAASLMLAACGGGSGEAPPDNLSTASADRTSPTVTITDSVADTAATGNVTFTFTFNKDVGTSFTADDITVTGGTKGTFTRIDGKSATLVVIPAANSTGTIQVSLAAGAVLDALGNSSLATSSLQAYNTVPPGPAVAAATPPARAAGDVLSVYSDAYTAVTGVNVNPDWGQATRVTEVEAAGNKTLKYTALNYQGTDWSANPINVSAMTRLHLDVWTADVTSLKVSVISAGKENAVTLTPTLSGWNSFDIDMAQFTAADKTAVIQLKIEGTPSGTVYLDNIYFWKPAAAAPTSNDLTLASFDEAPALPFAGFDGGEGSALDAAPPAGGGTGKALKVFRSGGQVWAGAKVNVGVIPLTAGNRTISARVYSPTAGVPMVLKLENITDAGINTGDIQATQAVVAGWQTLTWVVPADKVGPQYSWAVLLPNLATRASVSPGETYFFEDLKLVRPAVAAGTSLATFDEAPALPFAGFDGGEGSTIDAAPPSGGSGKAMKVFRTGGQVWAGAKVNVGVIPLTATDRTITARVYSPTAGVPMVLKLENITDSAINTGDIQATQAVVAGWQTLTWVVPADKVGQQYSWLVMLPNLGTRASASPGETYYFDDFRSSAAAATGGSSGGGGTPGVGMGAGGPQTLTLATGDVKTGDGGNTMFVAGEGLFAVNYVGSAEAAAPFNLAAWPNARSANFGSITGIAGGDIGYFQDDANLSNSSQKVDELGWITGTSYAPNGVPNFFRTFVLKGPVATGAYMGLYVNAPNNGTVNVSSFSKLKIKLWGPGPMFERTNLNPVVEVTLVGPKVAGCTSGSGGSEISQNLTANRKDGAGGFYTLPLSGFTVKTLCAGDTNAASVLTKLARVVVTVPGTSFNYTNLDGGNYATGVNLGPVGFTNN